ncbi:DUF4263 domain-containing protein [Priestia flexa]|uniref:DUF4263 domain-containing protein n=1 Tax=Priestia flexa TaxID=86664 RepID=UPI0021BD99D8|nr:DUF4263 domain-containing protein [Priestia flexa]
MSNEPGLTPIQRRKSTSGTVSFSDPVVIHESSRTRITFVPFFIPRSAGSELAIKIITYRKQPPPLDWMEIEEKSISLKEAASRNLLRALKEHLAVAEKDGDGDYIAIKVTEGVADVAGIDPSVVAKAVISMLNKKDIVRHLTMSEIGTEIVSALRTSIRLQELRSAVAELRQNLEGNVTDEQTYQIWCEKHSWAFGNAFVVRDSVRQIAPGDNIDLLLPTVIAGYRDLIELKRPDVEVLRYDNSHRNYYFSSDVSKAMGQCHRYLDVLNEVAANGLRDHPEVVAYHPRATIVIGRSNDWNEEKLKALHGLNNRLSGITVMTFDQLLLQGERLIELFTVHDNEELDEITEEEEDMDSNFKWDDDE